MDLGFPVKVPLGSSCNLFVLKWEPLYSKVVSDRSVGTTGRVPGPFSKVPRQP